MARPALVAALLLTVWSPVCATSPLELRVVVKEQEPFVSRDANGVFQGVFIDTLRYCVSVINNHGLHPAANLTIAEVYAPSDNLYGGAPVNGSWSGVVAEVANGRAHMSAAYLTITTLRQSVLHFSVPLLAVGNTLLVRKVQEESGVWAFLAPFTTSLWLSMLGLALVAALLGYHVDRTSPFGFKKHPHFRDDPEARRTLSRSNALHSSITPLIGDSPPASNAWSTRLVWLGYGVSIFLLVALYGSQLAAIATVKRVGGSVGGLDDVLATGQPVCVQDNTNVLTYLMTSQEPLVRALRPQVVRQPSNDDCAAMVRAGTAIAAVANLHINGWAVVRDPTCGTMLASPEPFTRGFSAFAFPRTPEGDALRAAFDAALVTTLESGVFSKLFEDQYLSQGCGSGADASLESSVMDLPQAAGIFFSAFILWSIALAVLGVEVLIAAPRTKALLGRVRDAAARRCGARVAATLCCCCRSPVLSAGGQHSTGKGRHLTAAGDGDGDDDTASFAVPIPPPAMPDAGHRSGSPVGTPRDAPPASIPDFGVRHGAASSASMPAAPLSRRAAAMAAAAGGAGAATSVCNPLPLSA